MLKQFVNDLTKYCNVQARPYQGRIITKILENYLEKEMNSILVEAPCGAGKTIVALLACKALQELTGIRIGWIAMRRNLLMQAAKENVDKKINANISFISMFEKNPPTNLDMLVVDEAQHDSTNSCLHLHNTIKPQYLLGLSGTPFRSDRVKLCFNTVIKDAGIYTLIKEGYLSQYHHYTIPEWGIKPVTDFYLMEPERWGKSIIYFHTVQQCEEAATRLQKRGIKCEVVTANSDREKQLDLFDSDKIKVLLNCMVLTEGFDCPNLQTVWCKPSCKGLTIQMAGRVLRPYPTIPAKQVIQAEKTKWPFMKTALPKMQYLWCKTEWRSLEPNSEIVNIQQNVIQTLATTETKMPDFITRRKLELSNRSSTRRRINNRE